MKKKNHKEVWAICILCPLTFFAVIVGGIALFLAKIFLWSGTTTSFEALVTWMFFLIILAILATIIVGAGIPLGTCFVRQWKFNMKRRKKLERILLKAGIPLKTPPHNFFIHSDQIYTTEKKKKEIVK